MTAIRVVYCQVQNNLFAHCLKIKADISPVAGTRISQSNQLFYPNLQVGISSMHHQEGKLKTQSPRQNSDVHMPNLAVPKIDSVFLRDSIPSMR